MENNFNEENTYKIVDSKNKNNFSFGKNILVPFCSGVIGSALVLGTVCFVPSIKDTLFNKDETSISSNSINTNEQNKNTITSNSISAVSIKNYSDTAIMVAEKVLPSIVGIEVEFPVTSSFYKMTSTSTSSGSGIIISDNGYINQ